MLFKSTGQTPAEVAFSILDEATYLTQEESNLNLVTVPVLSLDKGANLVDYDYLKQMVQEAGVDFRQARQAIAEVNGIDVSSLVTVIPDYELLVDPTIREDVGSYVLTPLPPDSDVYAFCEALVSLYEETGDESHLQELLEEVPASLIRALAADPTLKPAERHEAIESLKRKDRLEQEKKAQQQQQQSQPGPASIGSGMKRAFQVTQAKFDNLSKAASGGSKGGSAASGGNPSPGIGTRIMGGINAAKNAITGKAAAAKNRVQGAWNNQSDSRKKGIKIALATTGGAAVGGAILARLKRIRQEAASQPRSWIGKKVSALRSLYTNYLQRARMARSKGQASVFQTIASKILGVIDALMSRLQRVAG